MKTNWTITGHDGADLIKRYAINPQEIAKVSCEVIGDKNETTVATLSKKSKSPKPASLTVQRMVELCSGPFLDTQLEPQLGYNHLVWRITEHLRPTMGEVSRYYAQKTLKRLLETGVIKYDSGRFLKA